MSSKTQVARLREDEARLAEQAYLYILDKILRGAWPMGAEIHRRSVADELGMSVVPVGEALQRLAQESLVESDRRVGTRVRIPTPQEIRGYCIVREALETEAARLFAANALPAERHAIRRMAAQLDEMYERCADQAELHERNADQAEPPSDKALHELRLFHMQFHLRIAEGGGCAFLRQQIEKNQHLVFNLFYDNVFGKFRSPKEWHVSLAAALTGRDVEEAERTMRKHTQGHWQEILFKLEPFLNLDRERVTQSLNGCG